MATLAKDKPFYVPTIDIAPYLSNPHSAAAGKIIKDVRAACISTGFFQIVGHGVPKHLQRSIFEAAAGFFALSYDEKVKLDASKSVGHRGYDVLASQSYEEGVLPDLKEGFYVGSDIQPSDPMNGRFYMGPNIWPPESLISDAVFQNPCQNYYSALHDLSLRILELVGTTLISNEPNDQHLNGDKGTARDDLPPVFRDIGFSSPTPACPLRLLHYPAAKRTGSVSDKPQYGASAHTDFGAITLLLQDDNPGLEVLDVVKNVWRPIDPNPDAFVVNIGDMVSLVTGGAYKSSVHRVVCKRPEHDRYSVVFFLDGCLDAVLKPIQGASFLNGNSQNGYHEPPTRTVEQHMIERLTMSYGKGKKDARRDEETADN